MIKHNDSVIKDDFRRIFAAAVIFLISAGSAFSQVIPSNTAGKPVSENAPFEKKKDIPASAGSYSIEGGANYYRHKGNFYRDKVNSSGNAIVDSHGNKYNIWGVKVNPAAEFFLFDMFSFGGLLNFEYEKQGSDKQLTLGIGPMISFYLNKLGPVIPYISIFGVYRHTNFYSAETKSMYWTDQGMSVGGKAGIVCMISRQVGIFVDGRYTYGKHQVTVPPLTAQEKKRSYDIESCFGFKYFVF